MKKIILYLLFIICIFCFTISSFGQGKPLLPANPPQERDPFIPLTDAAGGFRVNFQKPENEIKIPHVKLMGLSKINGSYYAIIDGKWLKEGDTIKELLIEKIESEKVVLLFKGKKVELKLNAEKK